MARAWVGLGANLGDARASVETALRKLEALSHTRLLARSSLYLTAPVDASGDDYVNAVACLDTALSPMHLLESLFAIEQAFERERPYRNAPRTLDLDLLLYDEQQLQTETLTIPHPRMHERAFVLVPLLEVDAKARIPGKGAAADLLRDLGLQQVRKLATDG